MKETLKIRHYIIGLLYEAGKTSIPLMSVRKLAQHFGVAQCTVSAAVKELISENYVISRPGVGMFTNPNRLSLYMAEQRPPLIGVIIGDGRYFYLDHTAWQSLSPVIGALTARQYNVREINFESGNREEMLNEIMFASLDGLVWIDNFMYDSELLRCLVDRGLPVIVDHVEYDCVNVVGFDFVGAITRLAGELVAEHKRRILWCMPEYESMKTLPILEEAFQKNGQESQIIQIPYAAVDSESKLQAVLEQYEFDVVSSHNKFLGMIRNFYRDHNRCPEFLNWDIVSEEEAVRTNCGGWVFSLAERGEKTAERMAQLLNHDRSIQKIMLDMNLKRRGQQK